MKLAVENWGRGYGWMIVDNDADVTGEEGLMNRICVAGFKSEAAARRWLRVRELAQANGVQYGFRLGIGYD